jgi:heterodisulfide reductase subunit A-like polyferredoxin
MTKTKQSNPVLVIGAGAAGIAAAIAVAESGANVILIERYGFVGGLASSAMVGTICGLY